jgi:hypothetical protein
MEVYTLTLDFTTQGTEEPNMGLNTKVVSKIEYQYPIDLMLLMML